MTSPDGFDAIVARWRRAAVAVLPAGDRDLADEVSQHLAERWTRDAAKYGPETADTLARQELDRWRLTQPRVLPGTRAWTTGLAADLRYALRTVRARPVHAVAAVLLIAIAVAATTTAFAVAYGVAWRPLPYPAGDRLVALWQVVRGEQQQLSYPDYRDLAASPAFDATAAMMGGTGSLRIGDRIERVNVLDLEPSGFALLGATPLFGRLLTEGDVGTPHVLISHRLWATHLASDPDIIGRALWLSGATYTVVGVLAPGFDFELPVTPTFALREHDLWTPFDRRSGFIERRDVTTYEAIARIAPGVSAAQAQAAIDAIGTRLATEHAATNAHRTYRATPLLDDIVKDVRRPLGLVVLAALATFAVALANLVTLTLLRLRERRLELAIREALGAGHRRLRRQLLFEHALLAVLGGGAGMAAARTATRLLIDNEVGLLPRVDAIRFDTPVVAAAAVLIAVVPALLLALPSTTMPVGDALRSSGRTTVGGGRRLKSVLVATEVALALSLSAGGALLGLSLARLFAIDPGFAAEGLVAARVSAYAGQYPGVTDVERFVRDVVDRLAAHPDIVAAAAGSSLPLSGQTAGTGLAVQGRPVRVADRQTAGWQFVDPGYFDVLGMPIRRGRAFTRDDLAHEGHVTVINESLARALFGAGDPIGQRIGSGDGPQGGDWHEIVGVVGDVRHTALDAPPEPRAYDLLGEHWGRTVFVLVRSRLVPADSAVTTIRAAVAALDPEAPVFQGATMRALVDRSAASYRLAALMALVLAVAAVVLALLAVYAVMAGAVAERTREIGVRSALGAAPRQMLGLVFRNGVWTFAAGGAAGVAAAIGLSRLLAARLFGVDAGDTYAVVAGVTLLILAAMAAATWPAARRATKIDPLEAMRAD